jgi:hypothetical protein
MPPPSCLPSPSAPGLTTKLIELETRRGELEKINNLDQKISVELATLTERIKMMGSEMATLTNIDDLKLKFEAKKRVRGRFIIFIILIYLFTLYLMADFSSFSSLLFIFLYIFLIILRIRVEF